MSILDMFSLYGKNIKSIIQTLPAILRIWTKYMIPQGVNVLDAPIPCP